MGKFGTKNALLGYIWTRIFKKLSSYLKLVTSNLSISKILRKKQLCLYLWPKMPYLGVFCVLKKSAPLNLSNCKFSQEKQKCINL